VKPDGYLDGHPASSKFELFEEFCRKIIDMVKANQALWQDTAIMITVDEGGGYYDSGYIQPLDFFGDGSRIPLADRPQRHAPSRSRPRQSRPRRRRAWHTRSGPLSAPFHQEGRGVSPRCFRLGHEPFVTGTRPGTSTRSGSTRSSTRRRWSGTVSPEAEGVTARVWTPSVDSSLGTKLLPTVLSVIAGSVDVISFLGLGGLFTAHITGTLVILAAHVVSGGAAPLAPMLSVPVFMMDVGAVLLGRDPDEVAKARRRAKHTWPAIVGFIVGCGRGAACEAAVGLWSLALPTGLALLALAMSVAATLDGGQR
jgi:uncharacterized protein DUF1275/phosphoesterase family protein